MAYDLATVTNSGNQLLASVVTDHSSLVIDKIEVSGTKLASSTDLKSMTSISNVVKTLSANGYQKKDNSFIISTVLDNSSVDADYQAWVFGIWAHKADGGSSILISVITSTNSPDTISKGSGTPIDYNYKFITTFSNTNSLTIKMSSDTYAINDTVLHNSGDETATGTKTFQEIKISNNKFPSLVQTDGQYITLNNGATELVPADDSKVVHSADMRKPASDVAGIEEVNAKQDKIGYTPADDSKVAHLSGANNFDTVPTVDNNPLLLASSLPSDLARTGQANTFSSLQTFSQGVKTLQTGSYSDANSLVNEGLYYNTNSSIKNAAGSLTTGYIQVMSGGREIVRQIMYSDTDGGVIYDRTSQNGGSSWSNWVQILTWDQIPSDFVETDQPQTFTAQQTFSIAPIDQTTGHPYITKDGVPSLPPDLARTGQANTFSSLQTFSQGVKTLQTGSYDDANSLVNEGLYYNTNSSIKNAAGSLTTGYIQVMSGGREIVRQIMYSDTDGGVIYDRTSQNGGSSWSNWVQILTWDQIPSDFVETDQPQTFTAQQTFSIAPIDKTTGNPYITKDGVPSLPPDLARTGQANTFTAAQTFSIAPTITDASRAKGDNQAATMADLKSVEKSAWRQLNVPSQVFSTDYGSNSSYNASTDADYEGIYKINSNGKYLEICAAGYTTPSTNNYSSILLDLSSIINQITNIDVNILSTDGASDAIASFSGAILTATSPGHEASIISNNYGFAKVYYDKLLI